MCLAVYLASSHPLPTSEWNESEPTFYLTKSRTEADGAVAEKFSLANLFYMGSHQGCGCGFRKDFYDPEELAKSQADYEALFRLIRKAQMRGAIIEIYACWEGEQELPIQSHIFLTADTLIDPDFQFVERQMISISNA